MSHQVVFHPSYHHMALLVFSNCWKILQEKDVKAAWWRPGQCNGVTAFPQTFTKWLTVLLLRAHDVLNISCSLRHILKIVKHHLSQNLNIFLLSSDETNFLKLLYHLVFCSMIKILSYQKMYVFKDTSELWLRSLAIWTKLISIIKHLGFFYIPVVRIFAQYTCVLGSRVNQYKTSASFWTQ